ncbi:MAG: hypothetical protein ACI4EU_06955 [Butyrivibrio sp.]
MNKKKIIIISASVLAAVAVLVLVLVINNHTGKSKQKVSDNVTEIESETKEKSASTTTEYESAAVTKIKETTEGTTEKETEITEASTTEPKTIQETIPITEAPETQPPVAVTEAPVYVPQSTAAPTQAPQPTQSFTLPDPDSMVVVETYDFVDDSRIVYNSNGILDPYNTYIDTDSNFNNDTKIAILNYFMSFEQVNRYKEDGCSYSCGITDDVRDCVRKGYDIADINFVIWCDGCHYIFLCDYNNYVPYLYMTVNW